jgi:NAD(P)-dependent dehydrogenase (short-subunit alcohol dehydrogenase family)
VKRTRGRACETPRATYSTQSAIENATVCVTGANRGIGLELCKMFLSKGNVVNAACRRSSDELEALRATSGGRLKISSLDVSDEGSIERWARELKASGTTHLDVVVNNAGVVGTDGYTKWDLDDMTQEEMLYVFKVNTCGPVLVVKYLVREGLLGGDSDSLVGNVTSKVGSVDDNGSGRGYAYRASKSALNNCNKSMSIDLAEQNVHFALLHPGWVRTDMTEGRGLIDAEESAAGLISVLEGKFGDCETTWFDYKGDAIPW